MRYRMMRVVVCVAVMGAAAGLAEAQIATLPPFQTRVVFGSGDGSIGVDAPRLNEAGQLAFIKSLGAFDFEVIRYGLDGQLTTIFAKDQILPSGSTLVEVPYFTFAASGHILAYTVVLPPGATQELGDVHQYVPGTGIVDILPTADPFGSSPFIYLFLPAQNDLGQVVISTQVDRAHSTSNDDLLYVRHTDGSLDELARRGDATTMPGQFIDSISASPAIVNDRGDVTFRGTLADSEGTYTGTGNFRTSAGNPIEQLDMSAIGLNNIGGLGGKVGTSLTGEKIVIRPEGGPWQTLVQTGDTLGSAVFSDLGATTDYNDQQQVLFQAELTSLLTTNPPPPTDGLFLAGPDGVSMVARIGEPLPLPVPGLIRNIDRFLQMDLNNTGQVAFIAEMDDGSFGKALVLYDPTAGLTVLAFEGQSFEGGIITDLSFKQGTIYGNEYSGFNDSGEVAWGFLLDNGDFGIALYTNRALVPEPASLALLAGGTLVLLRRRR